MNIIPKINVLLAEPETKDHLLTKEALCNHDELELVDCICDGFEIINQIKQNSIDLLLLDLLISGMDGIAVLREIKNLNLKRSLVTILITPVTSEMVINEAARLGAIHAIAKPFNPSIITKRVVELYHEASKNYIFVDGKVVMITELRRQIMEFLHDLGFGSHLSGHRYLRCAIQYCVEQNKFIQPVTHELYPYVAKMEKSTANNVERSMRHAIETTWNKTDMEQLQRIFRYIPAGKMGRPSNSEFIARSTDIIMSKVSN